MGRIIKAGEHGPGERPSAPPPEDDGGSAAAAVAVIVAARAEAARTLADVRTVAAAVTLASKMAERIVGRAVALDASVMTEIAAEALAACRARGGRVRLRAHPDDLAALERGRAALLARLDGASALELVADETVGRAGCVVETPVGRVDARLEAQLAALERALAGDGDGDGDSGDGGGDGEAEHG